MCSVHVRILHQLTAKRVLPIIKCDQLSSSNASTPVMTKLARKRLVIFFVLRCSSPTESSCLKKAIWKWHATLPQITKPNINIQASLCHSLVYFEYNSRCSNLLLINSWINCMLAQLIIRYWASFTRDRDVAVAARRERCNTIFFQYIFQERKTEFRHNTMKIKDASPFSECIYSMFINQWIGTDRQQWYWSLHAVKM